MLYTKVKEQQVLILVVFGSFFVVLGSEKANHAVTKPCWKTICLLRSCDVLVFQEIPDIDDLSLDLEAASVKDNEVEHSLQAFCTLLT